MGGYQTVAALNCLIRMGIVTASEYGNIPWKIKALAGCFSELTCNIITDRKAKCSNTVATGRSSKDLNVIACAVKGASIPNVNSTTRDFCFSLYIIINSQYKG